jgi:hypothetical protein
MHLKGFLKLKKPLKLSLLGKYIKKTIKRKNPKKNKKPKKKPKNPKNHWTVFFLKPGFFQPCLLLALAQQLALLVLFALALRLLRANHLQLVLEGRVQVPVRLVEDPVGSGQRRVVARPVQRFHGAVPADAHVHDLAD